MDGLQHREIPAIFHPLSVQDGISVCNCEKAGVGFELDVLFVACIHRPQDEPWIPRLHALNLVDRIIEHRARGCSDRQNGIPRHAVSEAQMELVPFGEVD
eukprot:378993-Rhodomonas_salina.1